MNTRLNVFRTLKTAILALSPSCRDAVRMQSETLDCKLSILRRIGLRFHLLLCKWCRRYGRQITFLRLAARKSPDQDPAVTPAALSPEARERIQRRIRSELDSQPPN